MDVDGAYWFKVMIGMGRAFYFQQGDTMVMYVLSESEKEALRGPRTDKILESEKKKRADAPPAMAHRREWIAELMEKEPNIGDIRQFLATIAVDKQIRLVTDG
jgi:hypothetical protein